VRLPWFRVRSQRNQRVDPGDTFGVGEGGSIRIDWAAWHR
jgi:hypothetical protein